jgi:hypothetical protein
MASVNAGADGQQDMLRPDDLQQRRALRRIHWLREQLADLQVAMEMVRDGVHG